MRTVALLVLLACDPTEVSPGEVPEGPAEQRATAPQDRDATARDAGPATAPGMAATVAWDLRLVDLLLVHMQLTERLADAVASRASTSELRAYAEEERAAARSWRDELGALRARWFPDAPAPSLASAPTLTELGPTTQDFAARQGQAGLDRTGGQDPRTTPPATGQLQEGGDAHGDRPDVVEYGASRRLPEGQEIDMGEARAVDVPTGEDRSREDDAALLAWLTDRVVQLEAQSVDVRAAVEAMAPMHRRAISAAMAGETQATHPELRDLATRIHLAEQRALERLIRLQGGDRG